MAASESQLSEIRELIHSSAASTVGRISVGTGVGETPLVRNSVMRVGSATTTARQGGGVMVSIRNDLTARSAYGCFKISRMPVLRGFADSDRR